MDNDEKFVDFHTWCPKCEHKDLSESEDPCNDCLTCPVNTNSTKPVRFTPKEG